MAKQEARNVNYSRTTLTELMIPSYENFGGKIHGGILLSLMDKVAYACASKHAGAYCVTVSVDNVDFLQPVDVGHLVSLQASVNHVGNTSLVVGIRVQAEDIKSGEVSHTNTSYFTMVAKDSEGKPTRVPKLILESREDLRRFIEALHRKRFRKDYNESVATDKSKLKLDEEMEEIKDERCILQLS